MDKNKSPFATDISLLAETFGILPVEDSPELTTWLQTNETLRADEQQLLDKLYTRSKNLINYWNEEELKMRFISHLLLIADIEVDHRIALFYERPFSAKIDDHTLRVVADCLIATPATFARPKHPYFFMQEYKRSKGDYKDPEAQMLMAMMIAQELNQDGHPLYGSYVYGSRWRFCTLLDRNYCQSPEYDADKYDDLLQIVFVLRRLKELILARAVH
ncbi:MAG: hypothetical protein EAZ91_12595 [Cytophagales bacterium]|nr:MAG: hypothetical protein EAZ91_12595 [Cytophagales bacterium]